MLLYPLLLSIMSHKCYPIYIGMPIAVYQTRRCSLGTEFIGQSEYVRPMLEYNNSTVWSSALKKISFDSIFPEKIYQKNFQAGSWLP